MSEYDIYFEYHDGEFLGKTFETLWSWIQK